MKDYSAMSDLEINIEVAINQGYDREQCDLGWIDKSDVGVDWNEQTGYPTLSFNYCNNPADAWPIILENKINIDHRAGFKKPMAKACTDNSLYATHSNVLRAAMIVYLMMKDAEKGHG